MTRDSLIVTRRSGKCPMSGGHARSVQAGPSLPAKESHGNGGRNRWFFAGRQRIGSVEIDAFPLADLLIPAKHVARALEADEGSPGHAAERMREHAPCVLQDESRIEAERCRNVADFHPAIGFPSQVLDLVGIEVRTARDGGGAVVLLDARVDDETAFPEI